MLDQQLKWQLATAKAAAAGAGAASGSAQSTWKQQVLLMPLLFLLLLCLRMQGAAHLKMYGLAYLTASSPQPGSSFSADGEVRFVPVCKMGW
jgi:hypothetical protein